MAQPPLDPLDRHLAMQFQVRSPGCVVRRWTQREDEPEDAQLAATNSRCKDEVASVEALQSGRSTMGGFKATAC